MRRTIGGYLGRARLLSVVLALAGLTLVGVAVSDRGLDRVLDRGPGSSVPLPAPGALNPGSSQERREEAPEGAQPAVRPFLGASVPRSLSIPAIGVRSEVQRLGLAADGTMEVPVPGPRYDDAGWYQHSPTPGELGPSVIAGHVDSAADGPSVFYRLATLRPRDEVRVTRTDGTVAVFAVESVHRYRKSRFPTGLVYGNTDHAALRLITCGGPIEADGGHYRDNVVVFASLVRAVRAVRAVPASPANPLPG